MGSPSAPRSPALMNRFRTLAPIGALLFAAACSKGARTPATVPNPFKLDPQPTTAEITTQDLMTRLYIFADDSMMGRATGTEGYRKGTDYIAGELARLGVQPAGDSGGYFQNLPFGRRRIDVQSGLVLRGQRFEAGTDIRFALPEWRSRDFGGGLVIFAGSDPAALRRGEATNTVVVVTPGADGSLPQIGPEGPVRRSALVLVVNDGEPPESLARMFRTDSVVGFYPAGMATEGPMVGLITRAAAERMFGRSLDRVRPGTEIAGAPLNGVVLYAVEPLPARNVVGIIPGSNPALRGQFVALGAHADHVGYRRGGAVDHDSLRAINAQAWQAQGAYPGLPRLDVEQRQALTVNVDSLRAIRPARPDSINNGADDDGSGSMGLLEIAEAIALDSIRPARSVLLVWHAAEELGLQGARHFATNPTVPRDSIIAQINIDMIGRGGAADMRNGGPDYLALVGSRRLSTGLGNLVEEVNSRQPRPLALDYGLDADGHPENIYCRSDHYEYARFGIPVVFMFTGLHGDYHQVTDEPQYIDYPHYTRIVRFTHDVVRALATRRDRPVVDQPRPDPAARCRQ